MGGRDKDHEGPTEHTDRESTFGTRAAVLWTSRNYCLRDFADRSGASNDAEESLGQKGEAIAPAFGVVP